MIWKYVKYSAPPARKMSAGTVKTTPPATDSPADPIVCTMLFSRIVEPPSRFRTEIARTAIGIDALTVSPARRPRYTVEAPKRRPNSAPMAIALSVNSAGDCAAVTYGVNPGVDPFGAWPVDDGDSAMGGDISTGVFATIEPPL